MEVDTPAFMIPEDTLLKKAKADSITHVSTGIAVVWSGKVLAVRRAADDYLGGNYELPGGGVEQGETLRAAIERELREETSLEFVDVLGMFPGFDYSTPSKPRVRQFNFLVSVKNPQQVKLSPEHDAYSWLASEQEIESLLTTAVMKTCLHDALEVAADLASV